MSGPRSTHRWQERYPSQAARLLAHTPGSLSSIARTIGVSHTTLTRWLTGERTPNVLEALDVKRRLRIPCEAWGQGDTGDDTAAARALDLLRQEGRPLRGGEVRRRLGLRASTWREARRKLRREGHIHVIGRTIHLTDRGGVAS